MPVKYPETIHGVKTYVQPYLLREVDAEESKRISDAIVYTFDNRKILPDEDVVMEMSRAIDMHLPEDISEHILMRARMYYAERLYARGKLTEGKDRFQGMLHVGRVQYYNTETGRAEGFLYIKSSRRGGQITHLWSQKGFDPRTNTPPVIRVEYAKYLAIQAHGGSFVINRYDPEAEGPSGKGSIVRVNFQYSRVIPKAAKSNHRSFNEWVDDQPPHWYESIAE